MSKDIAQPDIKHLLASEHVPLLRYIKKLYRNVDVADDAVQQTLWRELLGESA